MEIVAARTLNTLYIYLDIIWLFAYAAILIYSRRYLAIIMGVVGGFIYFAVDYGIFIWHFIHVVSMAPILSGSCYG